MYDTFQENYHSATVDGVELIANVETLDFIRLGHNGEVKGDWSEYFPVPEHIPYKRFHFDIFDGMESSILSVYVRRKEDLLKAFNYLSQYGDYYLVTEHPQDMEEILSFIIETPIV